MNAKISSIKEIRLYCFEVNFVNKKRIQEKYFCSWTNLMFGSLIIIITLSVDI